MVHRGRVEQLEVIKRISRPSCRGCDVQGDEQRRLGVLATEIFLKPEKNCPRADDCQRPRRRCGGFGKATSGVAPWQGWDAAVKGSLCLGRNYNQTLSSPAMFGSGGVSPRESWKLHPWILRNQARESTRCPALTAKPGWIRSLRAGGALKKSSREHLKQPVALPTPGFNFPSKPAAGPAFRPSPGLGRASPRMQRLCGSLGFDTVCLAPALPALSLAGKRKCGFSCCFQTERLSVPGRMSCNGRV